MATKKAPRSPLASALPPSPLALLNLQDGMITDCCHTCGAEVERYDAAGRSWCAAHFPGCIRFTVANHHWGQPLNWLANPQAYTIMAAPPPWAKVNKRNLPFFAAPSELVFGGYSSAEYTERFSAEMKRRMPVVRQWLREHDGQHVTPLCACQTQSLSEKFCHRFLVAKLLTWLGCSEEPWVQMQRERQVAA